MVFVCAFLLQLVFSWPGLALDSTVDIISDDPVIEGTELVFAFMIHRHGDRTPTLEITKLIKNKNDSEFDELVKPWGYGQLTDAGKRTGYKTGQFIRRRYNDIIAPKYNKSEIYIRATDSTRTKMTILTAMSAVYTAGDGSWSDQVKWEPVPYTTVPAKFDFTLAIINCPNYMKAHNALLEKPNVRLNYCADLIKRISKLTGFNITHQPLQIFQIYNFYDSCSSLGYNIEDEIKDLMPEMRKATGIAWDITAGNKNYLNLGAGVILKEFFDNSRKIIAGEDTQKVRIYSGHDNNVFSMKAISRVKRSHGPVKYGSLFSLELRRVVETGQYVVLPVYLFDPHIGKEKYLQISGCGDGFLCDYDTFASITSRYLLDEDSWRTQCGFSYDMYVNTTKID